MKLEHKTLKKIIKEELYKVLKESLFLPGEVDKEEEAIKFLMDTFGLSRREAIDSMLKTGHELMKDPGYAMQHKELESNYRKKEKLFEDFKFAIYYGKRFLELKYGKNPPEEELQKIKENAIELLTKENKTDLEEKVFTAYNEQILDKYDSNEELIKLSSELAKLYKDAEKGFMFMDMQTPYEIKKLNKKVSEIKKQIDDEVFEKFIYAVVYAQNKEEFHRINSEFNERERQEIRREQERKRLEKEKQKTPEEKEREARKMKAQEDLLLSMAGVKTMEEFEKLSFEDQQRAVHAANPQGDRHWY